MASVESLPLISGLTHNLDSDIDELGLQNGVGRTLERYRVRWSVSAPTQTTDHLKNDAVLLISNHPFYIEPLALMAALPDRRDVYLIGNVFFKGLVPNLDLHLIPLFVRHRYFADGPGALGRFMDTIHPYPNIPKSEEHKRNAASLKEAAKKISEGSLVTIFPEAGSTRRDSCWSPGLSSILRMIDPSVEAKLVMAHIRGTSNLDYLRIFSFLGGVLPKISVTFSEAILVSEVLDENRSSNLTASLEERYKDWTSAFVKMKSRHPAFSSQG